VGELMGAAEIAERLGVSRQRVQQLVRRRDWPAPVAVLTMGKVWRTVDVEAWIKANRSNE
jgi:prophage regulatory protein